MKARIWIALVLATLIMVPAQAAVESVTRFSDAAYMFADVLASSSLPVNGYGVSAASPFGFGKISFLDPRKCRSGNCFKVRATAFAQIGEGQRKAAVFHASNSDSGAMTTLDIALMIAFAVGLMAYQLDRKQRVLQQSSLPSLSL